jgi:AraC-like DNA-binding protein
VRYLTDWRIALAQGRLREGRPIKQLSEELGYANASALSRVFTARVGKSPREWLATFVSSGDAQTARGL